MKFYAQSLRQHAVPTAPFRLCDNDLQSLGLHFRRRFLAHVYLERPVHFRFS